MNAIEIKNLTKSFPGFTLNNLNLTLPGGCILGLIGENGAGKSTTIKLILDIIHKDSGSITILGRDNTENILLTKEEVGVVMDEIGLPECLTAKQIGNVMAHTFRNWDASAYQALVQRMDLPEKKPFKDFSRGMKMKLGMYLSLNTWHILVFLYIMVASIVPVWSLLQPRDYLNSYLLIFMIIAAIVGVFVANPSCNLEAFVAFNVGGQYLFPILFVTIACGAVSGFHSLVSSGTASKQIKNERNMLPVSFGAMLMESMLAVISLIAVSSFASGEAAAQGLNTPAQVFAGAIANFLQVVGLPYNLVFTLINLAVSAFALTSLDSVARVGRLSFQEFWMEDGMDEKSMNPFLKLMTNKVFATVITLVLAYLLAKVGYKEIWPLFGSANQLLSVLALVACAVFLKRTKRKGFMLWAPMFFMMAVTFTALAMTIYSLSGALVTTGLTLGNTLQLIFAVLLLILGVLVAIQGTQKLFGKQPEEAAA